MAEAADDRDPARVVCKSITATGSRLGKTRVCRTNAEWDVQRQADQDATRATQVDRSATPQ